MLCFVPTAQSETATTVNEGIFHYKSENSAVYNPTNVRDGSIGVQNQAQLEAKSCNGGCTDDSYAGIYLELEMHDTETIVNISATYESWGEDSGLGETVPNEYQMSVFITHKFGTNGYLIEDTTTGYGNLRNVFIGTFSVPSNDTIIIDYFILHNDTNSFQDQASARIHEIFVEKGPSDSDGDGVSDGVDQCTTTPSSIDSVDETGCAGGSQSSDADNDGISDENDQCPNTLSGEQVDENGCSPSQLDSDQDGISDSNDQCPNTANGANVNFDGCSDAQLDSDDDGVSNADDECPGTENSAQVNMQGCSQAQLDADGDQDGVPNASDDCPDTPADTEVDSDGCEIQLTDSDGDGYHDQTDDKFPNDGSQWSDEDGDGYGDNASGYQPDACPSQFGKSTEDRFGCVDTDQDGYSDLNDPFPQNPTQWSDIDGDGYGDNQSGTEVDKFPDEVTQWSDSDGDGYGDNPNGNDSDSCVGTFGESYKDRFGCSDADKDGISDMNDKCANSLSSEGLVDDEGCNSNQIDSDGDGIADANDECGNTKSGSSVMNNGCASSTNSGTQSQDDANGDSILSGNLIPFLSGGAGILVSVVGYIVFRRRSAKSVEYLKLAKIANDLSEIQSIRNAIETDLAKGRLDPIVHSRIDSILDERHRFVVEQMNRTVENEFR